ncbi:MAG: LpqB family beta-propeller domain-containing protein, partial [Vicinamibacterales bacterium]
MALTPGTRLGSYEITAQIGVGGMGEVYRATDTNLKRQVAIKVLPASVAGDTERLARFQREAEVLAALNHPNIAAIYGLEKSDGTIALVMELVEGPTLADRIAQGAIPVDEALLIAKQIAEALEAAHEQGIIHRDLKPANIKVRPDGTVKVLDFGLAKAMESPSAMSPSVSQAPTITTPAMMTGVGMILGTAAYMSPEQAKGRAVDARADVWAFGVVLFEMVSGHRAFDGEDVADVLGAVTRLEPRWEVVPASVPPRVRQVLRGCLQKNVKARLAHIQDVRLALEGAFETAASQTTSSATSSAPRGRLAWMAAFAVAALGMVAMAVPTLRHLRETPPRPLPETRLEIGTPATDQPGSFALSPDGRQIVFVASGDGASRLWVRSLGATTAQPLAGTEGATYPFWSPDG